MINENKRKVRLTHLPRASIVTKGEGVDHTDHPAPRGFYRTLLVANLTNSYFVQQCESTTISTNKSRFVAWITTSLSGYTNGLRRVETTKSLDWEA